MKNKFAGIFALCLLLTASGWAQTQKAATAPKAGAKKQAAPATAAADVKKEAPAAAKAAATKVAAKPEAAAASDPAVPGRVTQVFTPKLPPLPDGAVQVDKHTWRATDKDGKVWIYRRTPFGFSKYQPEDQPAEEAVTDLVAVDKGETVEFQRKTPFGLSKWTKQKAELDENEVAALKRATPASSKGAQE